MIDLSGNQVINLFQLFLRKQNCCRQLAGKQPQTFKATDYLIIDL